MDEANAHAHLHPARACSVAAYSAVSADAGTAGGAAPSCARHLSATAAWPGDILLEGGEAFDDAEKDEASLITRDSAARRQAGPTTGVRPVLALPASCRLRCMAVKHVSSCNT